MKDILKKFEKAKGICTPIEEGTIMTTINKKLW
jgi:hypothetical protein